MSEPAVQIEQLSKRFKGGGAFVPLPHRLGASWLERGQRRGREEDFVDDLEDDDEVVDEAEPDEERPPGDGVVWALRDISLEVAAGSLVGIIGPNGGGKTTLLRILARTQGPTSGRAIVRGRVAPLLRAVEGMMLPRDSGRANVVHVAAFYGVARSEALRHVEQIAEFSGIGDRIDNAIRTYSAGELQRFAFGIAFGLEPDVMLADEIVTVGDMHFRNRCLEFIEQRSASGLTLLFASHNMDLVRRLCTEAVLLDAGEIVERGPVEEVVSSYEGVRAISRAQATDADEGTSEETIEGGPLASVGVYSVTGDPVDVIRTRDEALVEIVLDLDDAPMTLRCALALAAPDAILRSLQERAFVAETAGRYYVSARVDPGTLPGGRFHGRVVVFARTERGREIVSQRQHAFTLDVLDEQNLVEPPKARVAGGVPKANIALTWGVSRD